ncbi:MAG: sulfatase-like hydrolase/transferase [Deltaproteobacteria bacterium]|nr:sulfatase-like hydrolase/transferase [Deltaproteobacteria bacterium]
MTWNPLGRWRAAGAACAIATVAALEVCWRLVPQSRSVLPVRMTISALAIGLGAGLGLRYLPRLLARRRRRSRGVAAAIAGLALLVDVRTLLWRSDEFTAMKYAATTSSPAFDRIVQLVRFANDVDRDGYGSLLGENDCMPFDSSVHPGAKDIPDDGIDQDCNGRDFTLAEIAAPEGPTLPVPEAFRRDDWNFLFITIDTVRYDRTSFGGYPQAPKGRDTTPRLAELVAKSTSFTFAQAPSAGTMASIPAILTSKYFHSGIALDENRPAGTPPKIMDENTTLPEIMRRGGYRTGVIGSHEWWNDWGLDQGVDKADYDNTIGEKPDAYRVAADKVTDHALGWIARQQGKKWFLWAHYIDPHGRYVAHPDVVDYGSTEPDLYDAELRWTDQELGRLLDELVRLPSHGKTIVIITSDHGDSMGEHGIPVGTHGSALYKEMLHVPLIFYVPDGKPRAMRGAVTNLDVVPTVAELAGIDVHDLTFEGKSLVPQLFYGREERERVVFAETNAPGKQRAAISEQWKLIYYLSSNLYELYDLLADPQEKTNLASQSPPALAQMKAQLETWMNRVLYSRDEKFNQAARQIKDVRAWPGSPAPAVATTGQTLEGGKLAVVGMGPAAQAQLAPGKKGDVHVYFQVGDAPVATRYRFQLVVWPLADGAALGDALPAQAARSQLRATGDGAFASDRWPAGDHVRERFPVAVPNDWKATRMGVGLVAVDAGGTRVPASGLAPANDAHVMVLGELPLGVQPGSPAPPRP